MGKCIKGGKPTQQERHKLCTECYSKEQSASRSTPGRSARENRNVAPKSLSEDYLEGGYFGAIEGKLCRKGGIVTEKARTVAMALGDGKPRMTSHQLRRFFTHARRLEQRLHYGTTFDCLKSEIERLVTYAIDARAKQKVPRDFETFIRVNVELALQDEEHFTQGFMPHFEAVVAFFAYHFPKN